MKRALALLVLVGCRSARDGATARPSPEAWRYAVEIVGDGEALRVVADLACATPALVGVDADAAPYLRDLMLTHGEAVDAGALCHPPGCRAQYTFALAEAARAIRDDDVAASYGNASVAAASAWMIHPIDGRRGDVRIEFDRDAVAAPFARDAGAFVARDVDVELAPMFAFGGWRRVDDVLLAPSSEMPGVDEPAVRGWVAASRRTIDTYFQAVPAHTMVLVLPSADDEIEGKVLGGGGGATLEVSLGAARTAVTVATDWVLPHEWVHASLPTLGPPHQWLEEGIATYVEPVARARAGAIAIDGVWSDWLRDMPKGLPEAGDEGLEITHTWGRTYWGGALFCLLADVEIRSRTESKRSLDDALRAIARASGGASARWSIERFLDVGDAATGTRVLRELYDRHGHAAVATDLSTLWRSLGVAVDHGRIVFDDAAPLATVRRGILGAP